MAKGASGVNFVHGATVTDSDLFDTQWQKLLAAAHRKFEPVRQELLARRESRQKRFDAGEIIGFLPDTTSIRNGNWKVDDIPKPLQDRRVEITEPAEAKMMINALNSGAKVFMADFEDSLCPTWQNIVGGHEAVVAAVEGTLSYTDPKSKKEYSLKPKSDQALLEVRVRGLHLDEAHVTVDGEPVWGGLFDYVTSMYHTAELRIAQGEGPYYYIPKLEHFEEAALWNELIDFVEISLKLDHGATKVTLLIETFPAAFQMDEFLHVLKDHIVALNAGRWDYIFSAIKSRRQDGLAVLPDRSQVTMEVGFMAAYASRLIETCHRRGALAMGGMSAFIPNRSDPEVTTKALASVRADKKREAKLGHDGTWVAHPDLIPLAFEEFDAVMKGPNQVSKRIKLDSEHILSDFVIPGSSITEEGLRLNIEVAMRYIHAWLQGTGAVAIHNLMEDAATAEICRYQIWQWVEHGAATKTGRVSRDRVAMLADEISKQLAKELGAIGEAKELFLEVALAQDPPAFLTLPAYQKIR